MTKPSEWVAAELDRRRITPQRRPIEAAVARGSGIITGGHVPHIETLFRLAGHLNGNPSPSTPSAPPSASPPSPPARIVTEGPRSPAGSQDGDDEHQEETL